MRHDGQLVGSYFYAPWLGLERSFPEGTTRMNRRKDQDSWVQGLVGEAEVIRVP
jgi:hypothetical protein